MKIFANTIVNNEENFIWFAIMSVIDYVDKILVWDTGSTDNTVKIINEIKKIKGNKISFKEVGEVDNMTFTKLRQKMLDESICDWILILDGDEIWWEKSIRRVIVEIKKRGDKISGIVVPVKVSVGDIYHFQEENAGKYHLLGRVGHYNLRAINRKIPGLHLDFPHPDESFLDKNNIPIQEKNNIIFLDAPYLHTTHLKRSSTLRKYNKFKHEIGSPLIKDELPEILYRPYPKIVPFPRIRLSGMSLLKAKLLTPLRKLKRRLV